MLHHITPTFIFMCTISSMLCKVNVYYAAFLKTYAIVLIAIENELLSMIG